MRLKWRVYRVREIRECFERYVSIGRHRVKGNSRFIQKIKVQVYLESRKGRYCATRVVVSLTGSNKERSAKT